MIELYKVHLGGKAKNLSFMVGDNEVDTLEEAETTLADIFDKFGFPVAAQSNLQSQLILQAAETKEG